MATKIKFNFKKAKFKIAWLKALEEYNHLCKCRGLLMDMLGTYKQFLQAYESFK